MGDDIKFKVLPSRIEYGDERKFWQYRIAMYRDGVLAGVEIGPRRTTETLGSMWSAAKARIALLKTHRLFAIPITADCIRRGEGHNCNTCAVSQALWENQERMGLPRGYGKFNFRVESYGAFVDCRGIVLECHGEPDKAIERVEIATADNNGKPYSDSLEIWTMQFDEWFDFRTMAKVEWREKYDREKGDTAYRPAPASFVLDLDAMQVAQ